VNETTFSAAKSQLPVRERWAFRFNVKKAAQAANRLSRLSGETRNYMELIKLLFLADRAALLELERPITGDQIVALKYGLVLSHVLNLMKWGPCNEEDAPWFDTISAPRRLSCKIDPGNVCHQYW
jgi:hypothetical protein